MSTYARQRRLKRNRQGGPVALRALAAGSAIAVALAAVLAVLYVAEVWHSAPTLASEHGLLVGTPSEVFAADGTRLGFIQSSALRTPISWGQIPAVLKDATVSIEDQRFFHNNGIDPTSILRAAAADVLHGEKRQGASTITMQLVRNLYLGNDLKTFKQKLTEAKLAVEYNKRHSKREILGEYLNDVTYGTVGGQSALGVQAAALVFFNRPVWKLDLQQCALLAGLPQAPTSYNPFLHPVLARQRRNQVLAKMAQLGYITRSQAKLAEGAPLEVQRGYYYAKRLESFFFEYVRQELVERYGAATVNDGGLKVYTTLDLNKQRQAKSAIATVLPEAGDPAAAVVSVDPRSGYIRAMAESARYEGSQFNLAADAHRQAGSTFKTFVLLAGLEQGVSPYSTYYTSRPLNFTDPEWGPINIGSSQGTLGASYSVATALMQSNDPIFTLFDMDVGPQNVKHAAQEAGIQAPLEGNPAEALGGLRVGVSPLEMADAYATISSGGYRNRPIAISKVVFPDGRTDNLGRPQRKKVFSDGVTSEATKLLEQYITAGLGTSASYGCPYSGGKTGTTNNNVDAWFVGFTAHLSTAVWIGYPQGRIPMTSVQGVTVEGPNLPAQLWHDYMQAATSGECVPFAAATEPMVFKPFFGKYESSGPSEGGESTNSSSKKNKKKAKRGQGGNHAEGGAEAPAEEAGGGENESGEKPAAEAPEGKEPKTHEGGGGGGGETEAGNEGAGGAGGAAPKSGKHR